MSSNKATARDRVKAMREEQARRERRREQLMRFGVVAAVVLGVAIIVIAVMAVRDASDAPAAQPSGVTEEGGGVSEQGAASADVPVIEVWFDFSCPHCRDFEAANGDALAEMADEGVAGLVYRPVTFVGGAASVRATNAWVCAREQGMGEEFMDAAYARQGAYSNRELIDIGEDDVGIEGSEFASCVSGGTYNDWVNASHAVGTGEHGVDTTPTVFVVRGDERTEVPPEQWTPDGLRAAVEEAGGGEAGGDDAGGDEAGG